MSKKKIPAMLIILGCISLLVINGFEDLNFTLDPSVSNFIYLTLGSAGTTTLIQRFKK